MPRYSQQEIAVDSEKTRSSVEPRQSHNFAKKMENKFNEI